MATPALRFKKLFIAYNTTDRWTILNNLSTWVSTVQTDPKIGQFSNFLNQLQGFVTFDKKQLETHWVWTLANALNDSVAFQEVVKAKLGIPAKNIDAMLQKKDSPARKTIPKKTREAVWSKDCGSSTAGTCFCCSEAVTVLGSWHAGHIIAQSNGGADTVDNLRVVCSACNLAMGTENMDTFKTRCYPPKVDLSQRERERAALLRNNPGMSTAMLNAILNNIQNNRIR